MSSQLQQLTDRQAITDLVTRLGLMLDTKRYDVAPTIFTDDVAVRTAGGSASGRTAVIEHARRNHTVRTQHTLTDLLIDLDGDHAAAGANLTVTFVPDSADSRLTLGDAEVPEDRLTIGERYRFEAVRGEAGWRLQTIEIDRVWSTQPVPSGARVAQA